MRHYRQAGPDRLLWEAAWYILSLTKLHSYAAAAEELAALGDLDSGSYCTCIDLLAEETTVAEHKLPDGRYVVVNRRAGKLPTIEQVNATRVAEGFQELQPDEVEKLLGYGYEYEYQQQDAPEHVAPAPAGARPAPLIHRLGA